MSNGSGVSCSLVSSDGLCNVVLISGSRRTWLLWLGVAGITRVAVARVIGQRFSVSERGFGIHEFFFEKRQCRFITPSTALWQHYLQTAST